jgi:uncharacterized membrane protein YkoI
MQVSKAAVIFMLLLAALLTGFGVWQFGAVGLRGGEHEREHENAEEREHAAAMPLVQRIATEQGGRIAKAEREHRGDGEVYEIELVGPDGRTREILVDVESGRVLSSTR